MQRSPQDFDFFKFSGLKPFLQLFDTRNVKKSCFTKQTKNEAAFFWVQNNLRNILWELWHIKKHGWFFNSVGKLNYMCVPIKARVELSSQMHSLMLSINMRSRIADQHHFVTVLILAAKLVFVDYKSKNKVVKNK